jgi:GWxTD domain-containing protein
MWKAILAGTLAALVAFAAEKKEGNDLRSTGNGPGFRAQIGQRLSANEDSLLLFVAVSVPYDNLVFLRTDSGFSASFELVTTLLQDGQGLVGERIRNIHVETAAYAETNSRTKNAVHAEDFLAAPGSYTIRVTMTDQTDIHHKAKWEGKITLAQTDPLLRVSDIYWVQEDTNLAQLGVPRLVESFYSSEDSAHARVQLFSKGTDPIRLQWSVLTDAGDTVRTDVSFLPTSADVNTANYVLYFHDLTAQNYVLSLDAEGNGRREVRSRKFSIRLPGVPASITDLGQAIRQLKYVATTEENKRLRQADPSDRERLFREFWQRRDPTPKTEQNELMDEYYLRVQYANENFSTNREGWETDRGRIYVIYGPPTDIERHPFEADSRPYEIWYYSQIARRFVFVDYTGFGDYTLASPEWGY